MASQQQQQMWEMFVANLAGGLKGLDPAQFVPTTGLALADWQYMDVTGLPTTGKEKPGDPIVAGVLEWADTMPQWGPTYTPGNSFYDQYLAFLNAIQLKGGDPALQQIADGYATDLATARTKLTTDTTAMFAAWKDFTTQQAAIPAPYQQTFPEWYNSNWASTFSGDQSNLAAADKNYRQALQAVGGPDYATISRALTLATLSPGAGNTLTDASGVARPRYDITPDLASWYASALQTVVKGSPPQIDFTIDLSQADQYQGTASSYVDVSAGAEYSGFAWGGKAAASYSRSQSASDFTQLVQNLSLHYTAQTATAFNVSNPAWLDTGMIGEFKDQISPTSALANKPLLGAGGFLNLRTRQIVVAFRPTITLKGSTGDISNVVNAFQQQGSGSVSVAGMAWSVNASASAGNEAFSATLNTSSTGDSVTIADNTNNPKVIGVIPQQLGS